MTTIAIAADIPTPSRHEVAAFCEAELGATVSVLRQLDEEQWKRPTDCTGWTVRDLAAHLLGQYQAQASPWVLIRRLRAARRNYPDMPRLAAQNQQQIDDLRDLTTHQIIAAIEHTGPRAIRAVERTPTLIRQLGTRRIFPEEHLVDPHVGYIMDVLTCRDPWMHRVDLCGATSLDMTMDSHDRLIIEQVLGEIGRHWPTEPLLLHITGAVEGSWLLGQPTTTARTEIWADPVELMRLLAGRAARPPSRWHVDGDPRPAADLAEVRIVF